MSSRVWCGDLIAVDEPLFTPGALDECGDCPWNSAGALGCTRGHYRNRLCEVPVILGAVERERFASVVSDQSGSLVAVALEGGRMPAGATTTYPSSASALERFNKDFGGFDAAIGSPSAEITVLCAADDYLVWFGLQSAVEAVVLNLNTADDKFFAYVRRAQRSGRELQLFSSV